MAFPASSMRDPMAMLLADIATTALAVQRLATSASGRLAAGSALATEVLDLDVKLRRYRASLVTAAQTPGIREYAEQQSAFAGVDVVAEWQAMIAAIDAVTGWIRAHFPRDPDGYLLARTWGPDGPVDRTFTAAQTAGLRVVLDALAATVA